MIETSWFVGQCEVKASEEESYLCLLSTQLLGFGEILEILMASQDFKLLLVMNNKPQEENSYTPQSESELEENLSTSYTETKPETKSDMSNTEMQGAKQNVQPPQGQEEPAQTELEQQLAQQQQQYEQQKQQQAANEQRVANQTEAK
ncbi:hypothetical protein K435DRAFT_855599 [Dendrothele bispora CBS 962.96]|uniref:Uncharacterized protein n=1 Tax=Dendrothele bispora (strain CBS 962.96) TaxID=1314807 RepID=A0A4S8MAM7_DENBC|nr:hypothetical protein K435DRAFT_855599 [Dendrothele bispora CBS 962.96]